MRSVTDDDSYRKTLSDVIGVTRAALAIQVYLALSIAGAVIAPEAARACIGLPDAGPQELDRLRERDPEQAVRLATERLQNARDVPTPSIRAQYDIVIANARGSEGRGADARAALDDARRQYLQVPQGRAARLIELHIATSTFGASESPAQYQQGLSNLDRLVAQERPSSLEWTCLLIVRGDFQTELDRPDLAIADQLAAHRAAQQNGWEEASAMAAFTMATTYRRSGMWADAEQMIAETIAYATRRGLDRLLAISEFTNGQILGDESKWTEAFAALDRTQVLARRMGDTLTAAFATLPMCNALINSGRLPEAKTRCGADFATFVSMGRSDLATDSLMYQARIALIDKRFPDALRTLNSVLDEHLDDVPTRQKGLVYRERAEALEALGRYREATQNLGLSLAATDAMALTDRVRTVAILTGTSKALELESANERLEHENLLQRSQLDAQRVVRRLTIGVAAAGLLATALLAYLLVLSRRHRRALSRHSAVLSTLTNNLSDTVMLLGTDRRIQFSNRGLMDGRVPAPGQRLEDVLPPEAREPYIAAIASTARDGRPASFDASWPDATGRLLQFEQRVTAVVADGQLVGTTVRATDVTSRRALEEQLRVQARVLDTMNEGVLVVDDVGTISYANAAMHAVLGHAPAGLVGAPATAIGLGDDGEHPYQHLFTDGAPSRIECLLRRRDGLQRLVSLASSRLAFGDRSSLICVCRDISGQREVERAVAGETGMEAVRVGSSLHEGLAQDLTGVSFLLAGLTSRVKSLDQAASARADEVAQHLANAIRTARELAGAISPMAAISGALEAALAGFSEDLGRKLGVPVIFRVAEECPPVDGLIADQLFRIAQAGAAYALRRRRCRQLAIALAVGPDTVTLTIRSAGLPAETSAAEWTGFDFDVIDYRARLLGGRCEHATLDPDTGEIRVTVPRLRPPDRPMGGAAYEQRP